MHIHIKYIYIYFKEPKRQLGIEENWLVCQCFKPSHNAFFLSYFWIHLEILITIITVPQMKNYNFILRYTLVPLTQFGG